VDIVAIGTDIVECLRIGRMIEEHGEQFLTRVYTEREIRYCQSRKHAIEHYLDLARTGRVDVSAMLTHTFALDDWREAFETLAKQHDTGAIKAAFDFREAS